MKPIIGVIPLWDDEKNSIWMLPGYLNGIRLAGGNPVIFPLTDNQDEISQLMNMVDGVLLTGGHDVSPEIYGEDPIDESVVCCTERDRMETIVLNLAIEQNKSVLGICRGIQFINAVSGGKLYQDLPKQYPSKVNHHQSPPYDTPVHEVTIMTDTPLYNILGIENLSVNSYHHQAVKEIAPQLKPMAISEDGLIEAVYNPAMKFLWGLQWHPEFSYKTDINAEKIFKAFVESMIQ